MSSAPTGGSRDAPDLVFGYGSLVHTRALWRFLGRSDREAEGLRPASLDGFRRLWNVAMDNRERIPGYAHYLRPEDDERPALFVTFLNLRRSRGARVGGILFPVTWQELASLDRRERNYERVDVSARLVERVPGRVWTYIATADGLARYQAGRAGRCACISRGYHDTVHEGFRALGATAVRDFEESTDPPEVPIVPLVRVPGAG